MVGHRTTMNSTGRKKSHHLVRQHLCVVFFLPDCILFVFNALDTARGCVLECFVGTFFAPLRCLKCFPTKFESFNCDGCSFGNWDFVWH